VSGAPARTHKGAQKLTARLHLFGALFCMCGVWAWSVCNDAPFATRAAEFDRRVLESVSRAACGPGAGAMDGSGCRGALGQFMLSGAARLGPGSRQLRNRIKETDARCAIRRAIT